jgi:3-phenylpropionate/cinnamic acid dioxygenase small subunit
MEEIIIKIVQSLIKDGGTMIIIPIIFAVNFLMYKDQQKKTTEFIKITENYKYLSEKTLKILEKNLMILSDLEKSMTEIKTYIYVKDKFKK